MIIIVSVKNTRVGQKAPALPRVGLAALWLFSIFLLGYCLKAPTLAAESVRKALEVCAVGLIPSLFPFIVLVSIMNGSGLSARLAGLVGKPLGKLLGIGTEAVYPLILGAVGGFPIGAVCVRELYESGRLRRHDAERLLCIVSNASPAFCIGTVGVSLFSDAAFGVRLYLCQLAAALIIGIATRKNRVIVDGAPPKRKRRTLSDIVTDAVSGGGITMLKICAFAVFFAVVGDAVCLVCERFLGVGAAALIAALCELTLAGRRAAALSGIASKLVCALAVGWAGLSVHMQTASVMSGSGVGLGAYLRAKAVQGLLCTLFMLMLR